MYRLYLNLKEIPSNLKSDFLVKNLFYKNWFFNFLQSRLKSKMHFTQNNLSFKQVNDIEFYDQKYRERYSNNSSLLLNIKIILIYIYLEPRFVLHFKINLKRKNLNLLSILFNQSYLFSDIHQIFYKLKLNFPKTKEILIKINPINRALITKNSIYKSSSYLKFQSKQLLNTNYFNSCISFAHQLNSKKLSSKNLLLKTNIVDSINFVKNSLNNKIIYSFFIEPYFINKKESISYFRNFIIFKINNLNFKQTNLFFPIKIIKNKIIKKNYLVRITNFYNLNFQEQFNHINDEIILKHFAAICFAYGYLYSFAMQRLFLDIYNKKITTKKNLLPARSLAKDYLHSFAMQRTIKSFYNKKKKILKNKKISMLPPASNSYLSIASLCKASQTSSPSITELCKVTLASLKLPQPCIAYAMQGYPSNIWVAQRLPKSSPGKPGLNFGN